MQQTEVSKVHPQRNSLCGDLSPWENLPRFSLHTMMQPHPSKSHAVEVKTSKLLLIAVQGHPLLFEDTGFDYA